MKKNFQYILALFAILFFASCEKDNYEQPESDFTGRFVYQGSPLGLRHNLLRAELWQRGFGNFGVIEVFTTQDGLATARLFDGNYKFTISNAQAPFLWPKNAAGRPDSLDIVMSGSKSMDIEVRPYYMIRTPNITLASGQVTGTCSVEKIITDANGRNVESVTLFLNKTQFVDEDANKNIARKDATDITNLNNVSITMPVPTISPVQNYVFARIGVKIAGIENMIFSPVVKLNF